MPQNEQLSKNVSKFPIILIDLRAHAAPEGLIAIWSINCYESVGVSTSKREQYESDLHSFTFTHCLLNSALGVTALPLYFPSSGSE